MGSRRKLLVVGWDGADWALATPLVDCGQLPHLETLIERGVMGPLSSLVPLVSPALWTSIATGKRFDKHGVVLGVELHQDLGLLRPVSRASRRTAAFWNILDHRELNTHVVGWPASHPAEQLHGVCVSDGFATAVGPLEELWPFDETTVSPASVRSALRELRMHPGELERNDLRSFVPRPDLIDHSRDGRPAAIATILAETVSMHAAASRVMDHEPWDVMAVHYGGLERLTDLFLRYQLPQVPGVSEADCESYGEVVAAAYRFHDMMLGRLLELAGDDATVLLVSDHGFRTGQTRPGHADPPLAWRRGHGMLCLAGPGIRQDALIHQASVLDITPTILALFDLPIGSDMDGQPLLSAWEQPPVPRTITSWDVLLGPEPPAAPSANHQPELIAELRALGYAAPVVTTRGPLQRTLQHSEAYHLAVSHLHCARYQLAADLLRRLIDEGTADDLVWLQMAYCCCQLGDQAEARRMLTSIPDVSDRSREKALVTAMILIGEQRPDEALASLDVVRQTVGDEALIDYLAGQAYLRLRSYPHAQAAFETALTRDQDSAKAHLGLALAFAHQEVWEGAVDSALASVRLDHHQSDAHYLLGLSLVQLNRPEWAMQAFRTALTIRPDWAEAARWIRRLERKRARVQWTVGGQAMSSTADPLRS